jgi:hypothetical protein
MKAGDLPPGTEVDAAACGDDQLIKLMLAEHFLSDVEIGEEWYGDPPRMYGQGGGTKGAMGRNLRWWTREGQKKVNDFIRLVIDASGLLQGDQ